MTPSTSETASQIQSQLNDQLIQGFTNTGDTANLNSDQSKDSSTSVSNSDQAIINQITEADAKHKYDY